MALPAEPEAGVDELFEEGHLRIRHFYGTSENAVQTQIWIAVCVYALIAIVRKELGVTHSIAPDSSVGVKPRVV